MPDDQAEYDGCVYLVGAGPGDPGLITLRGVEVLGRADAVLYDFLVNPLVLKHARADAERICLGRHGTGRILTQEEINQQLIDFAQQGKTVVRLKGGDPAVFARVAEEAEALTAAGVAWEIVPGITAALAAPSYAGIAITHRDHASAVALVTGQEKTDGGDSKLDFDALAAFPGTLVFYMGVTTADRWTKSLIAAGRDPATPAAIVRRCTWTDQQVIRCQLDSIADELTIRCIRPPVLVVIGDTCAAAPTVSWFETRPLIGQTIMVTRPERQAYDMCHRLTELGAGCLVQPAIVVGPPTDWLPVDNALGQLEQYDWLVFSSANGVRAMLDRLCAGRGDLRRLGNVRLAAIGPRTADALATYHLTPDIQPADYRAEALAEALSDAASGQRFLLARASRGREILAESLTAAGGIVEQVVVYESRDVCQPAEDVARAIRDRRVDWITVTSSAIARSLVAMFGDQMKNVGLASISPVTSETLRQAGYEPTVEAKEFTTEGLINAIIKFVSTDSRPANK